MDYILVLVTLGVLIFVHELGHLWGARAAGIPVEAFSIGFGPSVYRWSAHGTEYRLGLVPLGGYVLPAVETYEDMLKIPIRRRMIFTIAGPVANVVFAVLLYAGAALASGDFSFTMGSLLKPFIQTGQVFSQLVRGLPVLLARPDQLTGIIGIVAIGGSSVALGFAQALSFGAFLSLNLALFNLLPIPALDGGKLLLYVLEWLSPRTMKLHVPLTVGGVVLLLVLIVYITALDLLRLVAAA